MVTYCSAPGRVYATCHRSGMPSNMVLLQAFGDDGRCERYDEEMTREEAQAEGIRQGYLVEFRKSEAFWKLAASFAKRRGGEYDHFAALCEREEFDQDEVYLKLVSRGLV